MSPLKQIRRRLSFYEQCEQMPPEATAAAKDHYQQDIAYLLEKIQRLRAKLHEQADHLYGKELQIETLREEKELLADRLEGYFEKYNWYRDVFEAPVVVGDVGRERRITDNRSEWEKKANF